jgi:hypothetical protein
MWSSEICKKYTVVLVAKLLDFNRAKRSAAVANSTKIIPRISSSSNTGLFFGFQPQTAMGRNEGFPPVFNFCLLDHQFFIYETVRFKCYLAFFLSS